MKHTELNKLIIRARQNDKQAIVQLYRDSCDMVFVGFHSNNFVAISISNIENLLPDIISDRTLE